MRRFLLNIVLLTIATLAMADAVGTWKLYPSYSDITEVQYSKADSSEVFVLASGNLFSYYDSDHTFSEFMIEGAQSATGTSYDILSDRDISHIAWCAAAKKLIIVYSDGMIDLLSTKNRSNPTVGSIVGLKETTVFTDKKVGSIYVGGQYAYLTTASHIIKIDVNDEYIVETYNTTNASEVDGMSSAILVEPVAPNYRYGATTVPEGPAFMEHNYIKYTGNVLYSVRGGYEGASATGMDTNTPGYLQMYDVHNLTWSTSNNDYSKTTNKNVIAFTCLDVDPSDVNHVVVGAKSGLYEYRNNVMTAYFDCNNSTYIKSALSDSYDLSIRRNYSVVTGVKFLSKDRVLLFNQQNRRAIFYSPNNDGGQGTFMNGEESTALPSETRLKTPRVDTRGHMWFSQDWWIPSAYGFYTMSDDKFHYCTSFTNQDGNILSSFTTMTRDVIEDKDNNIWFATNNGTFYLTEDQISKMEQSESCDDVLITQPKINRDDGSGLADYLLSGIGINAIVVDEVGRKWFATSENGIYCVSKDNQTQIYHYTTDNSPLPANGVKSLSLDNVNGILYIGTLNGLCSLTIDATSASGELSSDNVYAYPNPVTPEYTGDITIRGLTNGCSVRIVNTAGKVAHSGICNGGSFTWNGRDNSGNRVASGVYMVLVSDEEGENGCVTKIAVIK